MIDQQYFSGRLVADAELKGLPSGDSLLEFRMAQSNSRKTDSGEWETTSQLFIDVEVWRDAVELQRALTKGTPVVVKGQPVTQQWENKEGQKRSRILLNVRGGRDVWLNALNHAPAPQQATGGWGNTPAPAQPQQQPANNQQGQQSQQGFQPQLGDEEPPF